MTIIKVLKGKIYIRDLVKLSNKKNQCLDGLQNVIYVFNTKITGAGKVTKI